MKIKIIVSLDKYKIEHEEEIDSFNIFDLARNILDVIEYQSCIFSEKLACMYYKMNEKEVQQ